MKECVNSCVRWLYVVILINVFCDGSPCKAVRSSLRRGNHDAKFCIYKPSYTIMAPVVSNGNITTHTTMRKHHLSTFCSSFAVTSGTGVALFS